MRRFVPERGVKSEHGDGERGRQRHRSREHRQQRHPGQSAEAEKLYLSGYDNSRYSPDVRAIALYQIGLIYMSRYNDQRDDAKALDYFQERGWIELESKQMTEVYAVREAGFDMDALSDELYAYFKRHEASEIARIGAMLELFASDQCLSRRLARYFGDARAPEHCGHCSVCAGRVAHLPEPPALPPLDGQTLQSRCAAFLDKYQGARGMPPSADCVTRFLCGISVPAFTRLRARTLPGYAALEDYPYAQVRAWVMAQLAQG